MEKSAILFVDNGQNRDKDYSIVINEDVLGIVNGYKTLNIYVIQRIDDNTNTVLKDENVSQCPYVYSVSKDLKSAFTHLDGTSTKVLDLIIKDEIKLLHVFGVNTENVVKNTVLEALNVGLKVNFIKNLSQEKDRELAHQAIEEMRSAGATISIYPR